jgi:hypothetical protein
MMISIITIIIQTVVRQSVDHCGLSTVLIHHPGLVGSRLVHGRLSLSLSLVSSQAQPLPQSPLVERRKWCDIGVGNTLLFGIVIALYYYQAVVGLVVVGTSACRTLSTNLRYYYYYYSTRSSKIILDSRAEMLDVTNEPQTGQCHRGGCFTSLRCNDTRSHCYEAVHIETLQVE